MAQALFQPESGLLTVKYAPDENTIVTENPPRFTWMPADPIHNEYVLQISSSNEFSKDCTHTIQPIFYNYYTPSFTLEPGEYYWRYALLKDGEQASEWSKVRAFTISEDLPETPLLHRSERYEHTKSSHPRLWLTEDGVKHFREQLKENFDFCGWQTFYEKSVLPWLERELIPEPSRYPDNKRVADLWRKMYMDCQETLYAIRHLSVAGIILNDEKIINKAKEWLMHVVEWDTEGTTSRDYNDESAFRIAGAVAWGYDWLYNVLSDDERTKVRKNLLRRTEQVAFHVIERSKIHEVPFDSHAVRSLSSVLVPCCIAMLHEEPKAEEWLNYTLEYYSALYTPWGGVDGGWAEGPMYWTTGMAYLIDALNLLRNYTGIDFYKRPFFRKTGDFPLYVFSPDTIRTSFGDQSVLGDPPGLKTAFNIRQFAGITGNGYYQWYYEQVKKQDLDPDSKFYNYGWWDFRFDDMLYRYDYSEVEAVAPTDIEPVKWFRDVGWVAMHAKMDQPDEHIMYLTKSSPYGSVSHSHGDQNAFLLHAYGEPLAIATGYYIAFGSTMHLNWRRQTRSTNCILIDGEGQYAGRNKVLNMKAVGKILDVHTKQNYAYVKSDATEAYLENVPYLKQFIRETYFINQSYFVMIDSIDLDQPGKIQWLFHTLYKMKLNQERQNFIVEGKKAKLLGQFVYCSSGELSLSQHDQYLDVDPAELEGLSNQWHLQAETPQASKHRIVTLLVPMKKDENKFVSYFSDDQDHGIHMYFTDQGETNHIVVNKVY